MSYNPLWIDTYDTMADVPESHPWMSKTPEIDDDVDCFLEYGLDPELSKKVSDMIQAQADLLYWGPEKVDPEIEILDWAAVANPENDPDNYSCWKYSEYKEYMRQTFSYIPNSFWDWFNYDDMLIRLWQEEKYDIVYQDDEGLVLLEDVRPPQDNLGQWFKDHEDKSKFFILQYGLPAIHPLA